MKLEFVNEGLGIAAIDSLKDLGDVQLYHLVKTYGENAKLDNLVFIYMPDRDWIVLNKAHAMYSHYLCIIENYITLSPEARNEAQEHAPNYIIKSALYMLEGILKDRERIYKKVV